jgi:L-rhamnose mutarotase
VERQVFVLRLKEGALSEYVRIHHSIPSEWPDLEAAMRASGVVRIEIYSFEPYLILFAEVTDPNAFPNLWRTDVHKRWALLMDPLIQLDDTGRPSARFLESVYRFDGAGAPPGPEPINDSAQRN